jgi:hypothetical protein
MNREELHELVVMLKEELAAGRLRIRSALSIDSLKKVRYGSDGKVDPRTVDSAVRALGLAVLAGRSRKETKQIPLRDTQIAYFEMLDNLFGKPFSEMLQRGLDPYDVATSLAADSKLVEAFEGDLGEFSASVREFWGYHGPIVQAHLEDLGGLKSVFSGDISPSYLSNIACSVGLYMDTVVLPDPILRLIEYSSAPGSFKAQRLFFYLAKHALNILSYRDLALAEIEPPIVVIAPGLTSENNYSSVLAKVADADVIDHCSKLFGRSFSTVQEIVIFLNEVSGVSQLISLLADPSRLLVDAEWTESLPEQLQHHISKIKSEFRDPMTKDIGQVVLEMVVGRMLQANDALFESSRYGGCPLIDAPTAWQYLLWKYEYDAQRVAEPRSDIGNVLLSNAVQAEGSRELGLISGVPPEVLIELRRNGAMADLREIIGKGISSLNLASSTTFSDVKDLVISNIDAAFAEHEHELRNLSSSHRRFFGVDVGRWVVVGGISIAAAASAGPTIGIIAQLLAMGLGLPSAVDLSKKLKELQSKGESLKRSPTGILFRHLKGKFGFS